MKNKLIILMMIFILITGSAFSETQSQSADAAWETPCIEGPYGWEYRDETRSIAINRYSENGTTWFVADVQLKDVSDFRTILSPRGKKTVSELAKDSGVMLAINGDDFGTHNGGVIVRNGELMRTNDTNRCLLILEKDGSMRGLSEVTSKEAKSIAKELTDTGALQTFAFGPILVENGEAAAFPRSFNVVSLSSKRKEPRTAIGMISPLHYVIIVVDGRHPGYSEGISLQGMQELFIGCGAEFAFNLDGGGSSELWFDGEILNRPAGGYERNISDIIGF